MNVALLLGIVAWITVGLGTVVCMLEDQDAFPDIRTDKHDVAVLIVYTVFLFWVVYWLGRGVHRYRTRHQRLPRARGRQL